MNITDKKIFIVCCLLIWQLPIVLSIILMSPFVFRGYFDCQPNIDLCSRCHYTSYSFFTALDGIPVVKVSVSISGITANDSFLQVILVTSFALALAAYPGFYCWMLYVSKFNRHISPLYTIPIKNVIFASFSAIMSSFICLVIFPIRVGCTQSLWNVITHLSALMCIFFFSSKAVNTDRSDHPFVVALCIMIGLSMVIGTVCGVFDHLRMIFAWWEVLICVLICVWYTVKIEKSLQMRRHLKEY